MKLVYNYGHRKTGRYPSLLNRDWRSKLQAWMQVALDDFLGFHVDVPEPPDLDITSRRLMGKMQLKLFFVPAITEDQYPDSMVKLDRTYLEVEHLQSIKLPGCWVAYEVIPKPNYGERRYPDDQLMAAVGLETRFNHPHSETDARDNLLEDILPKVVEVLPLGVGGTVCLQSAEVFNFLGNFFNWVRENTANRFPDLGSTNSLEWCENCYAWRSALTVGDCLAGGIASVTDSLRNARAFDIGFRFLVKF